MLAAKLTMSFTANVLMPLPEYTRAEAEKEMTPDAIEKFKSEFANGLKSQYATQGVEILDATANFELVEV